MSKNTLFLFFLIAFFTSCGGGRQVAVNKERIVPYQPLPIEEKTYLPYNSRNNFKIAIDPGHGGEDEGTRSLSNPRYHEKYLTLTTSKWLKDYLTQMGYQVFLTRNDDRFIPLLQRSAFANNAEVNLFVSIHFNSAPSREAHGIEVFYYKSEKDASRSKDSKDLAARVLDKTLLTTFAKSRGVKHANFSVIRETQMPSILIEGGFVTNTQEMEKIRDPLYLKKLAWGIAQGIDNYLILRKN